jgi:ankyrin repeat protein
MAGAASGDLETIRILLAAKVDVNAKTNNGRTALMEASAGRDSDPKIVLALINAGVDVNAKTDSGETALTLAKKKNHEAIVQLLSSE